MKSGAGLAVAALLFVVILASTARRQNGLIVSGRQLTPGEISQLQQCLPVVPADDWIDPQGHVGNVGNVGNVGDVGNVAHVNDGSLGNVAKACQPPANTSVWTASGATSPSSDFSPDEGAATADLPANGWARVASR